MNQTEISSIIKSCNDSFNSSERSNFKNLWDTVTSYCRPAQDSIQGVAAPGQLKPVTRLIDIGINSLDTFTSGVTSTLIPKGTRFFQYELSSNAKNKSNTVDRWYGECTKRTNDILDNSNFFSEMAKSFSDLGLIGTSLVFVESDEDDGIRLKTFYINEFTFEEDSKGRLSRVYFKINMTANQIIDKFGFDNVSDAVKSAYEAGKSDKFVIVHAIYPRKDYKKDSFNPKAFKFVSVYIEEASKHLLLESGFKTMPCALGRWETATSEIYGRSPAMACQGNLSMINTMEYSMLRSAQRLSNPQWLAPNDGSVTGLNNNIGGIVYWNPTNLLSKPEQLRYGDMPQFAESKIESKMMEIEDSFYIPVFNPLKHVTGNTTATEIDSRVTIAKMNLVPKITRVINDLLQPVFKRIFQILLDSGMYSDAPEGVNLKDIKISFISSSGLIIRQLENAGILSTIETVGYLAQVKPEVTDYINFDEVVKSTARSNAVPNEVMRSDQEVKVIRKDRADAEIEMQNAQYAAELAKAYASTTTAPEVGSPAARLM